MSDALLQRIDQVRRRLRRVHLLAGVAQSALALIGLIFAFFLLDYLVLSRTFDGGAVDVMIRAGLVVAIIAIFGYVAWRSVVVELRTERSDDDIALRVERSHPTLRGRLISTVQLNRDHASESSMISQEMIDALADETVSFSEAMDFSTIINRRTLTRFGIAALLVVTVSSVLGWWRRDYAQALAGRLALTHATYPTAASILSVTPGRTIGRGDDFIIEVRLDAGRALPEEASTPLRGLDGRSTMLSLVRVAGSGSQALYRGLVAKAVDDFSFRPTALDARWSRWESVQVRQRPGLKGLKLTLHFPAYLGKPDEVSAIGDVRVPIGTTVQIEAQMAKALATATLTQRLQRRSEDGKISDTQQTQPLTLDAQHLAGSTSMTVSDNGTWSLALTDVDGFTNAEPISFTLSAIPDRPPTVSIQKPAQDKQTTRFGRWPVLFAARDDHAVAKAWLKYIVTTADQASNAQESGAAAAAASLADQSVAAKAVAIDFGPSQASVGGKIVFDLSQTGATEGQKVTYWIEVADNHEPTPNTGISPRYSFTVVDTATMTAQFEHDRNDLLNSIKNIRSKQTDIHTAVDATLKQTK